jgi:hypothetical protein
MLATIDAVQRQLVRDGLVFRWDGDTNGFVLCTYWLVETPGSAKRHRWSSRRQGADVVVNYLHDADGADETKRRIEGEGRRASVTGG